MLNTVFQIWEYGLDRYREIRRTVVNDDIHSAFKTSPEYELLRNSLETSVKYAEYGSGASTLFVLQNYKCEVRSVESDPLWARAVNNGASSRVVSFVNLGVIKSRGKPKQVPGRAKVEKYLNSIFSNGYSPDLVYVDGRFRIAAFATALWRSSAGTRILFDDYAAREGYHVVEKIISPLEVNSRQALFERPANLDVEEAQAMALSHLGKSF